MMFGCVTGSQATGSLPPPPWEAQSSDDGSPVAGSHYPQPMQVTTQVIVSHGLGGHPQGPQSMGNEVVGIGMYIQPITSGQMNSHVNPNHQLGLHPPQLPGMQNMGMPMPPQHPQANQMTQPYYPQQMYGNHNQYNSGYGYGHGQGQQQVPQYLDQQMYGLSVRDDMNMGNSSSQASALSYVPPMRPVNKPEDKLFGDLVDIAKFKPGKSTPGRAGSM